MAKGKALLRGVLWIGSIMLWILSIPPIRNLVFGKLIKKGQDKIVEAKAKIVS